MAKLCHQHQRQPPVPGTYEHSVFFKNLLYDDTKRVIYCYAPKTGCTNMKQSFVLMNGIYTSEELSGMNVTHEEHLWKAHSLASLSKTQRNYRLNNYFKFMVVRNPLERLLSAYRNKMATSDTVKFFQKIRTQIVKRFRRREQGSSCAPPNHFPTFTEFIDFINNTPLDPMHMDHHFQPISEICHPCIVRYHFYANFKLLDYDIDTLFHLLGIPPSYFSNKIEHPQSPTSQLLPKYFSQLSLWQKSELFSKFQFELNFYYSLYPEERNMHRKL